MNVTNLLGSFTNCVYSNRESENVSVTVNQERVVKNKVLNKVEISIHMYRAGHMFWFYASKSI